MPAENSKFLWIVLILSMITVGSILTQGMQENELSPLLTSKLLQTVDVNFSNTSLGLMSDANNYKGIRNLPLLVLRTMPGVVYIYTYDKDGNWLSSGSGFFINKEDIITCYHVINQTGLDHIEIYLYTPWYDSKVQNSSISKIADWMIRNNLTKQIPREIADLEFPKYSAKISKVDANYDLARLSIDKGSNGNYNYLLVNCSFPMLGEDIAVFGSPKGNYFSVTKGIVSAIRWPWEGYSGGTVTPEKANVPWVELFKATINLPFYIQFDAAASHGTSGGPLINIGEKS